MTNEPGKRKQHQLTKLNILETSAVDHPAHMHPGWLLKKSVGSDKADALIRALGKERNMPEIKNMPVFTGLLKSLSGSDVAVIRKALAEADDAAIQKELSEADIAPLRDGLAELWKVARDLADKGNDEIPSAEAAAAPAAPAAPDAASVLASADLQKAVGAEGVALLKAMQETAERTSKELALEKAARADEGAIAKAKVDFDGLDLDVTAFAPALRLFKEANPAAAAEIEKALAKTKELNGSAEAIITQEIGKAGGATPGSPAEKLNQIAKGYVDSGAEKSLEQAYAKACENNPELYDAARREKVS